MVNTKQTVKITGSFSSTTIIELARWLEERGYNVDARWEGAHVSTVTAEKEI